MFVPASLPSNGHLVCASCHGFITYVKKTHHSEKKKRIKYTHLLVSVMAARFLTSFSCFLEPRLSGFRLPSSVVSTGSVLTLWFTTDFAVSAQGFKALYEGRTPAMLCSRSLRADLALATRGGRFQCKREPPFRR